MSSCPANYNPHVDIQIRLLFLVSVTALVIQTLPLTLSPNNSDLKFLILMKALFSLLRTHSSRARKKFLSLACTSEAKQISVLSGLVSHKVVTIDPLGRESVEDLKVSRSKGNLGDYQLVIGKPHRQVARVYGTRKCQGRVGGSRSVNV